MWLGTAQLHFLCKASRVSHLDTYLYGQLGSDLLLFLLFLPWKLEAHAKGISFISSLHLPCRHTLIQRPTIQHLIEANQRQILLAQTFFHPELEVKNFLWKRELAVNGTELLGRNSPTASWLKRVVNNATKLNSSITAIWISTFYRGSLSDAIVFNTRHECCI